MWMLFLVEQKKKFVKLLMQSCPFQYSCEGPTGMDLILPSDFLPVVPRAVISH